MTSLKTFTGETLSVSSAGGVITVGGQAKVLVPDIQTKNATVYLIDKVMIPPSVSKGATAGTAAGSTADTMTTTVDTMTTTAATTAPSTAGSTAAGAPETV